MIRYTLACDAGHVFESWFPGSEAYDAQAARGLVTCPICDSHKVGKTLMAPALARTDRGGPALPPVGSGEAPAAPPAAATAAVSPAETPSPTGGAHEARVRALLRAVRAQVVREAENVGGRFPEAARAMHLGETPTRAIYGEASPAEARALIEEGIDLLPLPPDDRH